MGFILYFFKALGSALIFIYLYHMFMGDKVLKNVEDVKAFTKDLGKEEINVLQRLKEGRPVFFENDNMVFAVKIKKTPNTKDVATRTHQIFFLLEDLHRRGWIRWWNNNGTIVNEPEYLLKKDEKSYETYQQLLEKFQKSNEFEKFK